MNLNFYERKFKNFCISIALCTVIIYEKKTQEMKIKLFKIYFFR